MNNKVSTWFWRTKPRNILKIIQWFPYFAELEGQNWEMKDDNGYPVRRKYLYMACKDEHGYDDFETFNMEYFNSKVDKESRARNDKKTYEFFGLGFVEDHNSENPGKIVITDAGEKILNDLFDEEIYLKQLLKVCFTENQVDFIYPMELILKSIEKFGYINRIELGFLYECMNINELDLVFKEIEIFRDRFKDLNNKFSKKSINELFKAIHIEVFGKEPENKPESYFSYSDAVFRSLNYLNDIFSESGRGDLTRITVAPYGKSKFEQLLKKYTFNHNLKFDDQLDYMNWFGNINTTLLPWEDNTLRKDLIYEKINYLENEINKNKKVLSDLNVDINEYRAILSSLTLVDDLKQLEKSIVKDITTLNETMFINFYSKTDEQRAIILDRFDDILNDGDLAAMWLEVNTWKSLISINGEKVVLRNFNVQEDLTPKSFAPGANNTPDMEMYYKNYIIIPEVSLMSGAAQWEHEGSSVIDHVKKYIDENKDKKVVGLFISKRIDSRTLWQFFMLSKNSWLGMPIPVIPLSINQYIKLLKTMYKNNISIENFISLLFEIYSNALELDNYESWNSAIEGIISSWN